MKIYITWYQEPTRLQVIGSVWKGFETLLIRNIIIFYKEVIYMI